MESRPQLLGTRRRVVLACGFALATLAAAPPAPPPCTLLWGPVHECVLHGEYAKEGLFVDNSGRSFSVGFSDKFSTSAEAILFVYDAAGNVLSKNHWSLTPPQFNVAAGVWGESNGSAIVTVGTADTGNATNPRNLVLSRWLPGPGVPWTTPTLSNTLVLTPTALGLLGDRTIGCRVIAASPTDLFVSGCTNQELFVVRVDRTTLAPVSTWGTGGVVSIASLAPNGCVPHPMPGAFLLFAFHAQSFVEVSGTRLFLGGSLARTIPGTILVQDQDFVVDCFDAATGAPLWGNGGEYSGGAGDEWMKAMAVTSQGAYATGALGPWFTRQFQLVAWRNDGVIRAPGIVNFAVPSRGNDVEAYTVGSQTEIFVGGHGKVGANDTGAVWHFRHGPALVSPVVQLAQWSSNTAGGANPKGYGSSANAIDEVYDIGLGRGPHAGFVFAGGEAWISPTQMAQPLLCIAPSGSTSISTGQVQMGPLSDRTTAVHYHGSTTVFTHGTAEDPITGFWVCPPAGHWLTRNARYMP
jgi:hypothetical protein